MRHDFPWAEAQAVPLHVIFFNALYIHTLYIHALFFFPQTQRPALEPARLAAPQAVPLQPLGGLVLPAALRPVPLLPHGPA